MDKIEAKRAFLKLAYTKFKNLPLYLEWAPEGALSESVRGSSSTSGMCQLEHIVYKFGKVVDLENIIKMLTFVTLLFSKV